MKQTSYLIIFFLISLTTFSLLVIPGYSVFDFDHKVYIPAILQKLDPSLLQNDILTSFNQTTYTLFDEVVVSLIKIFKLNIFSTLFILSIATRLIFFYTIYKIALYFSKNQLFSLFCPLLMIAGFNIYGAGFNALPNYMVPKTMSLALCLLFLTFWLENKKLIATLPLSLGLLIHPITSLPFITIFFLDLTWNFFDTKRKLIKRLLLGAIPIIALILLFLSIGKNHLTMLANFTRIDPLWESIIRMRDTYIFISDWDYNAYLYLILSIIFLIVGRRELIEIFNNKILKHHFYILLLVPAGLTALSFLAVDIFKIHFFLQLQMSRSLLLWKIISVILFSLFAYENIKKNPLPSFYNFSLIGIILSLIFKEGFSFIYLPIFLYLWIAKNGFIDVIKRRMAVNDKLVAYILFAGSLAINTSVLLHRHSYTLLALLIINIFATTILMFLIPIFKIKLSFNRLYLLLSGSLIGASLIYLPNLSIEPSYFKDSDLMSTCNWIEQNTLPQDTFITVPYYSGDDDAIRLSCNRNIFVTYKDGAQAAFSRNYAIDWNNRIKIIKKISTDSTNLGAVIKQYNITYIFADKELDLKYPLAFNNNRYYIYNLK